jgi:hypothetical protein
VLEGTGRPVVERWLFLPVAGQAARVDTVEKRESISPMPPEAVATE